MTLYEKTKKTIMNIMPSPAKKQREGDDAEQTFRQYNRSFYRRIAESLMMSIGGLMISNTLNIVAVRMQNVDYPNRRSFLKALKDLVVVDKHRMFYKGLVPITIACTNLYCVTDLMHTFKHYEYPLTQYIWPFNFFLGTLIVHPFMLLGMRV